MVTVKSPLETKEVRAMEKEKIIAIAIRNDTSKIILLREGFKSHTAVKDGAEMHDIPTHRKEWVKGFFTNLGRFVGREEAMTIAREADQLKPDVSELETHLTSEDLR